MKVSALQAVTDTFELGEYHEPFFSENHYYQNIRSGNVYRCVRVDNDGYVVLTRRTPEGLVEIDPAPEFWNLFEEVHLGGS